MLKGIHLTLMMGAVVAKAVPKYVIDALLSVQVSAGSGQRSGFQLTFAVGKECPLMQKLLPSGFFDPLRRVIIAVTLKGQTSVLIDGVITRQELSPGNEPGHSTLTITGLDVTQIMDLIDFSFMIWPAMPAEARVAIILAKYAMYGIVPRIVPSVMFIAPNPLESIPSQEGTDFQYVSMLADHVGYVFYIEPGPTPGMNLAYWGPEIKTGTPQPALSVNMDAHTNVESLSFSFDGMAKKLYMLYIHEKNSGAPIPIPVPDISPINPPLGQKLPLPVQVRFLNKDLDKSKESDGIAKYSMLQAASRALGRAAQSADVISASGSLDVMRYGHILKARQLVGVRGAGVVYDGLYYAKSVTHTIRRGEYKQKFTLTRNALVSTSSEVRV